jgi:general secretion pathway protein C
MMADRAKIRAQSSIRMDLTKRLAQWQEQSPEQLLGTASRYLPPGVTAILVITIAYQLAGITWAVAPGTSPTISAPAAGPTTEPAPPTPSTNFELLLSAHLFGDAPTEAAPIVPVVMDAPDTTLSLSLTAIVFGEGGIGSQAGISSNRGQEKTYQIGQAIDNASGATLHSVYFDRVLLNRGGRLETLRLPKEPSATATARSPTPMMSPAASAPNGSLRQVISENASRLTDIVRLAPHVEGGQVVGFRVNPGRDRATFEALGLQPGDVVTDINGTVLDDPSQGLQAFEALGEATMANVTVLREGVPQVLVIDTSQLQKLQENRE